MLGEQQEKFQALYFHTCNLADDREAMIEVEEKNKGMLKHQELLIKQLKNRVASLVHKQHGALGAAAVYHYLLHLGLCLCLQHQGLPGQDLPCNGCQETGGVPWHLQDADHSG